MSGSGTLAAHAYSFILILLKQCQLKAGQRLCRARQELRQALHSHVHVQGSFLALKHIIKSIRCLVLYTSKTCQAYCWSALYLVYKVARHLSQQHRDTAQEVK